MASIKAFVFDLDDTLYDESLFVQGGTTAVLKWLANRYNVEFHLLSRIMNSVIIVSPRKDWYQKLIEKIGIPSSQELIDEMIEIYRNHIPNIHLFPDSAPFLSNARKKEGSFLGLITDGMVSVQESKIRNLGLDKIMDSRVFTWSKGVDFQKPHEWSFKYIQKNAGVPGEECCYFGDDPNKDFLAPNRLGWRTVCLLRHKNRDIKIPTPEHAAQIEIDSFDEINLD